MQDAACACIDPVLPGLQIRGVKMDTAGRGVLIFRGLASPSIETFHPYNSLRIEKLPVRFPRIHYQNQGDREVVLKLVLSDLIDAAGSPRDDLPLKLLW
jgi:hypothetical protein